MDDMFAFGVLCLPCIEMAISCHIMAVKEMEVLKVARQKYTTADNLLCVSCGKRRSLLYRTTDTTEVIEIFVRKFDLTMGPDVRSPEAAVATDDVSLSLGYGGDEDGQAVTETLGRVGSPREKTGAFVSGVAADGAEIRTPLEGVSGGMERVIDVILPIVLESREQDFPDIRDNYFPLRRRGEVFSVPAATIAVASDINRLLLRKFGVEQGATLKLYQDLDIKKVVNEAIARRNVAEAAASAYHDGDKARSFLCRICHASTTTADLINLGCSCKLDLGRAHRKCAQRWFQLKGDRLCEICKMTAQNVQLPRLLNFSVRDSSINHQDVTIPLQPLHSVQDSSVRRQQSMCEKLCALGLFIVLAGVFAWSCYRCKRDSKHC